MMKDIFILDADLRVTGVIDSYASLIWSKRYADVGDCELYLPADADKIELLRKGHYLARADDDMVCRIVKLEIKTSVDDGDFVTVTGRDAKAFLDQRIIWGTATCNGNVEEIVQNLVLDSCISPDNPDRALLKANDEPLLTLDDSAGLHTIVSEQISYKPIGEKIREYCTAYGYGYRFRIDLRNRIMRFGMYAGVDRHRNVIFSKDFDNLSSSDYTDDETNMANVALIGGQGEGSERVLDVYGGGFGVDRYETFVDADDMSTEITFGELKDIYPLVADGGTAYITGSGETWSYMVGTLDIQIMSDEHLEDLRHDKPGGTEITISGHLFYRLTNAKAASMTAQTPDEGDTVTLENFVYDVYLLNRGREKLAEYGRVITFDASILPDVTYQYKRDYDLGDLITIENKFGIRSIARISEIVEVNDTENGYSFEPTLEFIDYVEGKPAGSNDLAAEDDENILTEADMTIIVEGEANGN